MSDPKRTPLVQTDDGQLADADTGEILKHPPGPDPYTGTTLVPMIRPDVEVNALPAHPPNLSQALERWRDDREYVKRFLLTYLVESDYDDKGRPMKGRMHDYYRLPGKGEPEWKPTAVGAEKVALFFGLFKGPTEVHVLSETKEYVSIRARVVLVDARGLVRGSAEKVGSSAEQTFQAASYKYGNPPDWRAALNDIASRMAKRAYVEAVSITCALGELFNEIAREKAKQPKGQVTAGQQSQSTDANGVKRADPQPDARGLPTVMPVGAHAGEKLTSLKTEFLKKAREACRGRAEYSKLADAIDEVLLQRSEGT